MLINWIMDIHGICICGVVIRLMCMNFSYSEKEFVLLPGFIILGQLLNLSVPHFPHLWNGNNNTIEFDYVVPTAFEYEWNTPVLGFCNQVGPHGCQRSHQADSRLCSDPRFLRPGLCKVGFAHSYPLGSHFWALLREWQMGSLLEVTWLPPAVM